MLTEHLATKIVSRTMAIIHRNVNVMDKTGTIIASGDHSRYGQRHDGARQVLMKNRIVEIYSKTINRWKGSQPGINLPIRFQDKIVGVIGITGEPDDIRSYSKLVQMGAELTIEQAFLMNEIERNQQMRRNFITSILLGVEATGDYVLERARYLNISTTETFAVIIISPLNNNICLEKIERDIQSLLTDGDECVHLFHRRYVILKKINRHLNTSETLKTFIQNHSSLSLLSHTTIAISSLANGVDSWRTLYKEAKHIQEVTDILYPNGGVWNSHDLELALFSYHLLKDSPYIAEKMIAKYKHLFSVEDGDTLHQTLLTYISENGKMRKTAEKLFIHRNTLTYRLEKIKHVTGKDPKKLQDLLSLAVSQLLYMLA